MAMEEVQLTPGHYQDDVLPINAQKCENMYWRIDEEGGKHALHATPGLTRWVNLAAAT